MDADHRARGAAEGGGAGRTTATTILDISAAWRPSTTRACSGSRSTVESPPTTTSTRLHVRHQSALPGRTAPNVGASAASRSATDNTWAPRRRSWARASPGPARRRRTPSMHPVRPQRAHDRHGAFGPRRDAVDRVGRRGELGDRRPQRAARLQRAEPPGKIMHVDRDGRASAATPSARRTPTSPTSARSSSRRAAQPVPLHAAPRRRARARRRRLEHLRGVRADPRTRAARTSGGRATRALHHTAGYSGRAECPRSTPRRARRRRRAPDYEYTHVAPARSWAARSTPAAQYPAALQGLDLPRRLRHGRRAPRAARRLREAHERRRLCQRARRARRSRSGPDRRSGHRQLRHRRAGHRLGQGDRYTAGNTPPSAVASGTPSNGAPPLAVSFSSAGSSDADGDPLGYSGTSATARPCPPRRTPATPTPRPAPTPRR